MSNKITQVVIWGHKLHSHTHSYIHNGFFIGFQKLGYKTSWYDDNDDVDGIDFSCTLFLTEHQVCKKIPLRDDCLYLSHYVDDGDFTGVPKENIIILKVSQRDFLEMDKNKNYLYLPLDYGVPLEYYAECDGYNALYTYWATDLFPEEIDRNIDLIPMLDTSDKVINFVGSMTNVWNHLYTICVQNNIEFNNYGASFNVSSYKNKTIKENMELIQKSLIAPALQDDNQVIKKYIPCRIFKNISYGKMGITNNKIVHELFDHKTIYNDDIVALCNEGIYFETQSDPKVKHARVKELMDIVKDKHTYLNRIQTILRFVKDFTIFFIEDP